MTDAQSNRLDIFNLVSSFYTVHQAVIDLVPARTSAFTQHNANRAAILTAVGGQSSSTTGPTLDKAQAREQLDLLTDTVFAPVRAWAAVNNDNTTREQFAFSLSQISQIKDDTIQAFLELRINIVNANLSALSDYGITPVLVTQWHDALTLYLSFLTAPRGAIVQRSVQTSNLRTLFKLTSDHLRNVADPLMVTLRASQPDIFDEYTRSRIIIDRKGPGSASNPPAPGQTMKLTGTVTHAVTAAPLPNVEVTIIRTSGNITVLTIASGNYTTNAIQLTASETVQVRFRRAELNDRTETVTLVPGHDKVLNVTMTPATLFFGNVTDNLGNTLPGTTVRFSNAEMMMEAQTDTNGNYRLPFSGLTQPQSGTLTAMEASMTPSSLPVTITPGELQEQNFTLSPMAPPPPPCPEASTPPSLRTWAAYREPPLSQMAEGGLGFSELRS